MNKVEMQELLTEAEIEFSEEMTKAQLQELIDANPECFEDDSDADNSEESGLDIPVSEGNSMHISEEVLEAIVKEDIVKMAELIVDPEFEKQIKHKMELDDEGFDTVKVKILEEAKIILDARKEEAANELPEGCELVELKLRKRHPHKSFRIGSHVVGIKFDTYEMNEAEMKELKNKGCKTWLISKEEFEANKKKKASAKDKK